MYSRDHNDPNVQTQRVILAWSGTTPVAPFRLEQPVQVKSFRVRRVEVPLSYYTYNGGGFSFKEDGGADIPIVIPAGSYTDVALATTIEALMNAATGLARTYDLSISTTTGLTTITSDAGTVQISVWADSQLPEILGFTALPTAVAISITGSSVANVGTHNHVYLQCRELARLFGSAVGPVLNSEGIPDTIARIQIDQGAFHVVFADLTPIPAFDRAPGSNPRVRSVELTELNFAIVRPDTRAAVDFNGVPFGVEIELEVWPR